MQQRIILFSENSVPALSEVGGKAKALIETTKAGLPVPDGMVLCSFFFEPWIERLKSEAAWTPLRSNVTRENCDMLKKTAEGFRFDDIQKADFDKKLMKIDSTIYAVRSSSPEEDLERTSFAGMYETFLGVDKGDLERHVAKVFASMLDFRVMEYKRTHQMDLANSKIAVIVQKQLRSDVSGIGFSINPHSNYYDEVVINASWGLGEAIVSGIVTSDQYVVDTSYNKIVEKKINEKAVALYLSADGTQVRKEYDKSQKKALTDKQILEVASLIKKCEAQYRVPVDTEWAYEGEKLYLLQARPITTYFPLYDEYKTQPGQTKNLYLDLNKLTQGFEWSMSELGGDIFTRLIDVAKQGMMPSGKDGIVYCVHGRIYLLVNNMCKAFGKTMLMKTVGSYDTPTKSILESFSFEGYIPKRKPQKTKGALGNTLRFGLKSIIPIMKAKKDINIAVTGYTSCAEKAINDLEKIKDSKLNFSEQVDFSIEVFNRLMTAFMPLALALLAESSLKKLFKGKDCSDDVAALNMDLSGNPTAEMGHMQVKLASSPDFASCVNADEFIYKLKNNDFSNGFMSIFREYMRRYGCRCIGEIDIASIRSYEDLFSFYRTLKHINTAENALQTVKQKKSEAYNRLLDKAKLMRKEDVFIKLAGRLQWMGLREHPKYIFVYAVDILRQNILILADRLVTEGRLQNRNDIFMIGLEQINKAQNDSSYDLIPIANQNRTARMLTAEIKNWPSMVDSRGKIFTAIRKGESGDLIGDPVSPGIVKGKAKVINFPFEKVLDSGEILVAKATEPTWTPMFVNATAVVMEVGGALQHGAIIAREYGIPCVTGVQSITQIIKDGDMIEVDGTNGIVRIMKTRSGGV